MHSHDMDEWLNRDFDQEPEFELIEDPETLRSFKRVGRALFLAFLVAAILNSEAFLRYVSPPESGVKGVVHALAEAWNDQMVAGGLDSFVGDVRASVESIQDVSWGDVRAAFGVGDDTFTPSANDGNRPVRLRGPYG